MNYNRLDLLELKEAFKDNAEEALSNIYKYHRKAFLSFAKKYCQNETFIIDAFQDAVIVLYQNLNEEKIKKNGLVKSYLFEIGKHKLFNCLRKENSEVKVISLEHIKKKHSNFHHEMQDEGQKTIILSAINKLGKTCQKLLLLYYYRKYSINAIMHTLDMKTENSVKANKSRCIKQLKNYLKPTNTL